MLYLSLYNYSFKLLFLNTSLILSILLAGFNANAQDKTAYRTDTLHLSISGTYLFLSIGAGVEFPIKQSSIGFKTTYTYFFNTYQNHFLEYKHYSLLSEPGRQFYVGGHLAYNFTEHDNFQLWGGEESSWNGQWYRSESLSIGPLCGFRMYSDHELFWDILFGFNVGYRRGTRRWDHYDPDTNEYQFRQYDHDSGFKYNIRIGLAVGLQFYRKGFFRNKVE